MATDQGGNSEAGHDTCSDLVLRGEKQDPSLNIGGGKSVWVEAAGWDVLCFLFATDNGGNSYILYDPAIPVIIRIRNGLNSDAAVRRVSRTHRLVSIRTGASSRQDFQRKRRARQISALV